MFQRLLESPAPNGASSLQTEGAFRLAARNMLRAVTRSRTNYWLSYAFDLATPIAMGALGFQQPTRWSVALPCFCTGAIVFSFVEYAMHRWLFHARASFATAIHHTHHVSPREPFAIPCPSSAAAAVLCWCVLAPLVGHQAACFLACGLLAAYCYYGLLHHLQHTIRIKSLPLLRLRRRWEAHAIHHGRLDVNFGVTTSLWDYVFGTHHRSRNRSAQ